jgi:hypothetical protein
MLEFFDDFDTTLELLSTEKMQNYGFYDYK